MPGGGRPNKASNEGAAWLTGASDAWVSAGSGSVTSLGRRVFVLDGAAGHFSGDGSRALYRDSAARPGRVFAVDPSTGGSRYVADDDALRATPIPGDSRWLVVVDPALAPSGLTPGLPAGLYVLAP